MNRFFMLFSFVIFSAILTSCSSTPSLELIKSKADIVTDKNIGGAIGITEGDMKGQELVPTTLYYEFTIKNTGNQNVGTSNNKGIEVKIEPSQHLVNTSEEIVGFNIFTPSSYNETGLGYGSSFDPVIPPNKIGHYTLTFDLGVSEDNPQVPIKVPPKEKLEKLKNAALDASLIITVDGKEITRFNLREE
ncbi:hypothetical protein [Neobacillus mesonae]|uniref:hypothetical protein n=1 Tax=Neobacillus mesonae TaxID=1193713 RepID=UPI00203C762B|nr:hypothetical protein [Neobacillus mesonae]MCM3567701.1 hypothetical protein [Neobacillus mesonae]